MVLDRGERNLFPKLSALLRPISLREVPRSPFSPVPISMLN